MTERGVDRQHRLADGVDGLLVVDKPSGWTSHDVVARVRRLAGTRRVGHAGTLDPMATGVLVLGLGRATRLLGHLSGGDKEYEATIRLGQSTLSDDAEGELTASTDASGLDLAEVEAAIRGLTGDIEQVPSSVSAIKVDGRRAYAKVRAGEQVVLAARPVTVSEFLLLGSTRGAGVTDLHVRVTCSSGTYIRALARDLGDQLGVGGHLTSLRRTRVGPFRLDTAVKLDRLEAGDTSASDDDTSTRLRASGGFVPLDDAAPMIFPVVRVPANEADGVRNGRPLSRQVTELADRGPVALLTEQGEFLALYETRGDHAVAVAVFATH